MDDCGVTGNQADVLALMVLLMRAFQVRSSPIVSKYNNAGHVSLPFPVCEQNVRTNHCKGHVVDGRTHLLTYPHLQIN